MSEERQLATDILATFARPIANQSIEFGDKVAVGTGAALVLIVSQLSDLKGFISPFAFFLACVLAIVSLLCYLLARWKGVQANVLSGTQLQVQSLANRAKSGTFRFSTFLDETVAISVWPASWLIRFAQKKEPMGPQESIIHAAQKATRYIALQIAFMFAALVSLLFSFSFIERPTEPTNVAPPSATLIFMGKTDDPAQH